MWPVPSQERGGEARGETKRPCSSNPRTSLSCCSNTRSSESSLASRGQAPDAPRGPGAGGAAGWGRMAAVLKGSGQPTGPNELPREGADSVDTPIHAKVNIRRT